MPVWELDHTDIPLNYWHEAEAYFGQQYDMQPAAWLGSLYLRTKGHDVSPERLLGIEEFKPTTRAELRKQIANSGIKRVVRKVKKQTGEPIVEKPPEPIVEPLKITVEPSKPKKPRKPRSPKPKTPATRKPRKKQVPPT